MEKFDIDVEEIKAMAHNIVKNMQVVGYEKEDLVLEGILAGLKAQEDFIEDKGVKFSTFLYAAIKYRIYYIKRKSLAKKRNPDISVTLESTIVAETGSFYGKTLTSSTDQEKEYLSQELKLEMDSFLKKNLKTKDREIFYYILSGYTTEEIANKLGYDPRKLSNKISYIRRKLKKNKERIEKK